MADEADILDEAPADFGTDKEGRRIIYRHTFAKPVQVHGKRSGEGSVLYEAREMSFREPSAADIRDNGMPSRIVNDGQKMWYEIDEPKMTAMMAALLVSDDPAPARSALVARMLAGDWATISYELSLFFRPTMSAA